MKKLIALIGLITVVQTGRAQTVEEWLEQRKTQRKYLLQQIAALNVYVNHVQEGYSIVQKGLTVIGNIKEGDFNLHRDFFGSLKSINPKISSYAKVADIMALQVQIMQVYRNMCKQAEATYLLQQAEREYVFTFFTHLLKDCTAVFGELKAILTPGELEMTSDERLKRIDALYSSMQQNYTIAQSFAAEATLLVAQRQKEKTDVQTSRRLNGVKTE